MAKPLETFGKYKLVERLAVGGMAEVFRGVAHGEAGFTKPVVIKRLHPRLTEDDVFIQMLIDEARITSQLHHGNICQVLDLGSERGSYYIAMEFIPGEDLRTIQDMCGRVDKPLQIEAAIYIVSEMLAGLDYAHRKEGPDGKNWGIIHRDMSPHNVLVSYEGEVKIIDFGIAKARMRLVQTQSGIIKGKYRYMSPEQAAGEHCDNRTDLFAVGVVLYELLRGSPHSVKVPNGEVLRRMQEAEFAPLENFRRDLPEELVRIVKIALAKDRNNRFASCGEFDRHLSRFLHGTGVSYGRSNLAELMKSVFSEDRRRHRTGSFLRGLLNDSLAPGERPETDRRSSDSWERTAQMTARTPTPGKALFASSKSHDPTRDDPSPKGAPLVPQSSDGPTCIAHKKGPEQRNKSAQKESWNTVKEPTRDYRTGNDSAKAGEMSTDLESSDWDIELEPAPAPTGEREKPVDRKKEKREKKEAEKEARKEAEKEARKEAKKKKEQKKQEKQEKLEKNREEKRERAGEGSRVAGVLQIMVVLVLAGGVVVGAYFLLDIPSLLNLGSDSLEDGSTTNQPFDLSGPSAEKQVDYGTIKVRSKPSGAAIRLCGKDTGKTTPATVKLPSGKKCFLELRAKGFEKWRMPVKTKPGEAQNFKTKLRKLRKSDTKVRVVAPPKREDETTKGSLTGTLIVTSIQQGLVFVNGQKMGNTPRATIPLGPGVHSVWVYFPSRGTTSTKKSVRIEKGKRSSVHFDSSL